MKKSLPIFTTACAALTACIMSCKRDDASRSKTELITSKSWMETKAEVTYSGVTTDVSDTFLQSC